MIKAGWGRPEASAAPDDFRRAGVSVGSGSAAGVGILYGAWRRRRARPIALRWIVGHDPRRLRQAIGPAFFIVGFSWHWRARRRVVCRGVRAARALRRRDPGCSAPCSCSSKYRTASAGASSRRAPWSLLSSTSSYWTGHQLMRRLVAAAPRLRARPMFCVPGVLWLIVQARWQAAPGLGVEANAQRSGFRFENRALLRLKLRLESCQPRWFGLRVAMALCTNCFASSICSSTSAMSILGLPGKRSLWQ